MKKYQLSILASLLLLFSCKKDYLPEEIYVAGIVVSLTTHLPVENVQVVLREKNGSFIIGGGIEKTRVETDSSGRYSFVFSTNNTGSYRLTFDKLDYSAYQVSIDKSKAIHVINVELPESQF